MAGVTWKHAGALCVVIVFGAGSACTQDKPAPAPAPRPAPAAAGTVPTDASSAKTSDPSGEDIVAADACARTGDVQCVVQLMRMALGPYGNTAEGGEWLNELLWNTMAHNAQLSVDALAQLSAEDRGRLLTEVYEHPIHDMLDMQSAYEGLTRATIPPAVAADVARITAVAKRDAERTRKQGDVPGGVVLTREEHPLVSAGVGDRSIHVEQSIKKKVRETFFKVLEQDEITGHTVLNISEESSLFLVVGDDEIINENDWGLRLYLYAEKDSGYTRIARTQPGAADAYVLRPALWAGAGKRVILAESGTEYFWGAEVYELTDAGFTYVGRLDAAAVSKSGESGPSAITPCVDVVRLHDLWEVRASCDVVLNPGGQRERVIVRVGGAPIIFRTRGQEFVAVPATYRGAKSTSGD